MYDHLCLLTKIQFFLQEKYACVLAVFLGIVNSVYMFMNGKQVFLPKRGVGLATRVKILYEKNPIYGVT